jgi:hypothetical protein
MSSLNRIEMAKQGIKNGNVLSNCGRNLAIAVLHFLTEINEVLCR